MNIQALTEKYRPKALKDIRGQDHITKTLSRFIAAPTPKAFVFHGPSGCGKTSAGAVVVDVEKTECTAGSWEEFYHVVFTLPDGTRATKDTPAGKMSHWRAQYFESYREAKAQFEAIAARAGLPVLEVFALFKAWQAAQWEAKNFQCDIPDFAATVPDAAPAAAVLGAGENAELARVDSLAAIPDANQPATRAIVTENKAKGGIEIRFPAKPAATVLDQLKANGWRWTRFGGCWYKRADAATRAWAAAFIGGGKLPAPSEQPGPDRFDMQVEDNMAAACSL
ncbi:MAG: hypothetical protein ABFD89_06875 [Bryobacteraceae bacterium]